MQVGESRAVQWVGALGRGGPFCLSALLDVGDFFHDDFGQVPGRGILGLESRDQS
jgi:hypothetical protein